MMRRFALAAALSIGVSSAAMAGSLVTNGDFTAFTGPASGGQMDFNVSVSGWTSPGYNFLFTPDLGTSKTDADTTGALGKYGQVILWGPGSGSANGLTAPPTGNWAALDGGGPVTGPLTQTINSLTVGDVYNLSFVWGAAQQSGFTGANTEKLTVALGSESFDTTLLNNPTQGFTYAGPTSFSFTATSSSEVLSFLATGTPGGVPPFALLSDVSLSDTTVHVPEPASLALVGVALLGLGAARRRRG